MNELLNRDLRRSVASGGAFSLETSRRMTQLVIHCQAMRRASHALLPICSWKDSACERTLVLILFYMETRQPL